MHTFGSLSSVKHDGLWSSAWVSFSICSTYHINNLEHNGSEKTTLNDLHSIRNIIGYISYSHTCARSNLAALRIAMAVAGHLSAALALRGTRGGLPPVVGRAVCFRRPILLSIVLKNYESSVCIFQKYRVFCFTFTVLILYIPEVTFRNLA